MNVAAMLPGIKRAMDMLRLVTFFAFAKYIAQLIFPDPAILALVASILGGIQALNTIG